jgi:hypothetical protein
MCGLKTGKYDNIGFWKDESQKKHDKTFCLNCVLEYDIQAPHIGELLFEGEPKLYDEEDAICLIVESSVGVTSHSFRVSRRTEVWTDPGPDLTSAGPAKRSREYDVTEVKSKKAPVEVIKPKESSPEYMTDYWANYVRKYADK